MSRVLDPKGLPTFFNNLEDIYFRLLRFATALETEQLAITWQESMKTRSSLMRLYTSTPELELTEMLSDSAG